MTPEAGGGCAGAGGDNDDDFNSGSGSGLEIVYPWTNKIDICSDYFVRLQSIYTY